jgi:hypothetical protein
MMPERATEATSAAAYELVEATLAVRQQDVLTGLERYRRVHGCWPTGYELSEFMRRRRLGTVRDPNGVRPRLTELLYAKRVGHEWIGDQPLKRKCTVTGVKALTWRLPDGTLF